MQQTSLPVGNHSQESAFSSCSSIFCAAYDTRILSLPILSLRPLDCCFTITVGQIVHEVQDHWKMSHRGCFHTRNEQYRISFIFVTASQQLMTDIRQRTPTKKQVSFLVSPFRFNYLLADRRVWIHKLTFKKSMGAFFPFLARTDSSSAAVSSLADAQLHRTRAAALWKWQPISLFIISLPVLPMQSLCCRS